MLARVMSCVPQEAPVEEEHMYSVRAEHQSDHAEISQVLIGLFRNTFGVQMFRLILCEGAGECFQKLVRNLPVTGRLAGCSTVL